MGIAHIEDLSTPDFLNTVEAIGTMQATEKLDGANLYFGIDLETDKLFTSREGKRSSAQRYFSADDYPYFGGTNPFRAAHLALQNEEKIIRSVLSAGQTIEIEVLFGRQPNAITYGAEDKSYIAFLRSVEETRAEVVDQLTAVMLGRTTAVQTKVVASEDGINLDLQNKETVFEFIGPQYIEINDVQADNELRSKVQDFNTFLNQQNTDVPESLGEITNGELDAMSLTSVKKDDRDVVKHIKEQLKADILNRFKLPIKKYLLNKLTGDKKSKLSATNLEDSEDLGIEGIVLRNPTTGKLTKIVDKTAFTAINSFNHTVRGQISGTVRTINPEAPLETRGGVAGHMKMQIAKALGIPELARAGQAKKILAQFDTDSNPLNTIKDFANSLAINDFNGKKRFIAAIISQALKDLNQLRKEFIENKDSYRLYLANGKVIGLSPEIVRRTMLNFAEAQVDMTELLENVKASSTLPQLLIVLYGHALDKKKDETAELSEAVKKKPVKKKTSSNSARWDINKNRLAGKDAWTLMNIYFATVFLSVLMHKTGDKIGMRYLRDKTNFRMAGLRTDMSPLNFWGYPIWKSGTTAAKKMIGARNARELNKVVRRIPPAWYKFLHMDLSSGNTLKVNWADHLRTMQILQQFPGMKFERVSFILKGIFGYENLTYDQKIKVLNSLHLYVAQFIPNSPFFIRLKDIQRALLFNPNNEEAIMTLSELYEPQTRSIRAVHRDTTNETVSGGVTGVVANPALAGPLFGAKHGKQNVVKRKRNPDIHYVAFKKPKDSAI